VVVAIVQLVSLPGLSHKRKNSSTKLKKKSVVPTLTAPSHSKLTISSHNSVKLNKALSITLSSAFISRKQTISEHALIIPVNMLALLIPIQLAQSSLNVRAVGLNGEKRLTSRQASSPKTRSIMKDLISERYLIKSGKKSGLEDVQDVTLLSREMEAVII